MYELLDKSTSPLYDVWMKPQPKDTERTEEYYKIKELQLLVERYEAALKVTAELLYSTVQGRAR